LLSLRRFSTSKAELPQPKEQTSNAPLRNDDIPSLPHLIINHDGKSLGVMSPKIFLKTMNRDAFVLLQVQKGPKNPICKVMSRSELYQKEKAKTNQKPKSSVRKMFEVGVSITEHDLNIKCKKAKECLGKGYTVEIAVLVKGKQRFCADNKKSVTQFLEEQFAGYAITKEETKTRRDVVRFVVRQKKV
jgi:translation initiation factor IF-3